MKFGTECFNCFQQGHCGVSVSFPHAKRKPLSFCGQACAEAFVREEMIPKQLKQNQECLEGLKEMLADVKEDPFHSFFYKKTITVAIMLRTSLGLRKPKAELRRLYTLWQECATETLQKISDDKELTDSLSLGWAEGMKEHDLDYDHLIESLGR